MIVQRHVFKAKWGCGEKLVALLTEEWEKRGLCYRIYTPITGPWPTVVVEGEFQSQDEREKFWAELSARPDIPAYVDKMGEVVESVDIQLLTLV